MMGFLAQVVFVGRNEDFEGWVQILIFVIIVVGYVISGILKAASKKTEKAAEGEKRQGGRAGAAARRQFRMVPQPERPEVMRPEPVLQQLAEIEKALQTREIEAQVKPKLAITTQQTETKIPELPEIKPGIEKLPKFTGGTIKGLEYSSIARVTKAEEKTQVLYPATLWLNISDPEDIRRAILHYEILGKPLSLRGYGEQIIGL